MKKPLKLLFFLGVFSLLWTVPTWAAGDVTNGVCRPKPGFNQNTWSDLCKLNKISSSICQPTNQLGVIVNTYSLDDHKILCGSYSDNETECSNQTVDYEGPIKLCYYMPHYSKISVKVEPDKISTVTKNINGVENVWCEDCKGVEVQLNADKTQVTFTLNPVENNDGVDVQMPVMFYVKMKSGFKDNLTVFDGETRTIVLIYTIPPTNHNIAEYESTNLEIPDASGFNQIGTMDVKILIARAIKGLLGVIGSLSLVMFIYGGILFMTDRGSGEQAGKARDILVWTSLGLAVIFAAYALVNFIFEAFT